MEINQGTSGVADEITVDTAKVVDDLFWLTDQCELRCMFEQTKWVNEQLHFLPSSYLNDYDKSTYNKVDCGSSMSKLPTNRRALISFVRSLIMNRDYPRAKFLLSQTERNTSLEVFLYYFSWYLITERNKMENGGDELPGPNEIDQQKDRKQESIQNEFAHLRDDLESLKTSSPDLFDCFLNYLLGLIRRKNGSDEMAVKAFQEAIVQDNRCWPAWESLAQLVDGYYAAKIEKEPFAQSWFYKLFAAEIMFRHQLYVYAIESYTEVSRYIGASPYILAQIAAAQSEMQEHDNAIIAFKKIRNKDPYRLDQMHFYSDSLYIRQNQVELSVLAHWFYESHKYHWETCCIVANYYSAKGIHEQSQDFLKRAIRLSPSNASIWVLLGHEYLETKNHESAIESYKKATTIDPNCYRAWYGLGQLYEILKQPAQSLFYYQKAHKCRPDDSRMLIALGVTFSKLDRKSDAEKCFKKAFQIGDVEGNALTHLAKLYDEQGDSKNATKAYEAYLTIYTEELVGDLNLIATACRYLARYYLEQERLDDAYEKAQRCLNFDLSKEEGYRILQLIKSKRREELEEKIVSRTLGTTPSQQRNMSATMRTPADAPRPFGGGDDTLQTPLQNRREVDLEGTDEGDRDRSHHSDEDMNTGSDDDIEVEQISF